MSTPKRIGDVVRILREETRLTQLQLQERAGLGAGTIGDIERTESDPKDSTLEAIATKGLGMTYEAFVRRRLEIQWGVVFQTPMDPMTRQMAERIKELSLRGQMAVEAVIMAVEEHMQRGPHK